MLLWACVHRGHFPANTLVGAEHHSTGNLIPGVTRPVGDSCHSNYGICPTVYSTDLLNRPVARITLFYLLILIVSQFYASHLRETGTPPEVKFPLATKLKI